MGAWPGARSLAAARWMHRRCPPFLLDPICDRLGDVAWSLDVRRRRALVSNQQRLRPGDRTSGPGVFARRAFRHLVRCNVDLLGVPEMTRDAILGWIAFSGADVLEQARSAGRGVIVVGAHLGNFELAAITASLLAPPASMLVERIDPARDAALASLRTATGLRLIPADEHAARAALRVLRRGETLVIAGDRVVTSNAARIAPFGAGRRPVPIGPAWLAVRSGAPLVVGYAVRTPGAPRPYRAVVEAVPVADGAADPVVALTERLAARLGAVASQFADQWFVFDPQWRADTPPGA